MSIDDTIPKPTWYPLKFNMNAPYSEENGARILVSFAKISFDDNFAVEAEKIELDAMKKYETPLS